MNETIRPPSAPPVWARWVPGWMLFRRYEWAWLPADAGAGLSICAVMIPSVVAYAGLMGLPPQHGLYAALVPLLVYPLFGTSRHLVVGPDIAISLLVASAIGPLAGGDSVRAAGFASLVALLTGLLLLVGGRFRIGAVADFLSKPVLVGYMTGAALILIASQLDKLFGLPLKNTDFFPRLAELGSKLGRIHQPTLLLGAGLLALLFGLRRFAPRVPPALAAFVVAVAVSQGLALERHGVAVIGSFPKGLPVFAFPLESWHDVHTLLPAAIGIALLTYTEGILLARAFAAKHGYEVNPNQELTALGLADVFAGLFQGFTVTGSQARTTINDTAGAKTQLSCLVAAVALALFLVFLTPLMARVPAVTLAAMLIYGGLNLVEFQVMARIYRYYPGSGLLAALTTLGVLAVGVVPGILLGVALSLLGLINRISHPPDALLCEVPGHGFHDLGSPTTAQAVPGLLAYRFYAPLLFSNAGHFVQRVRELIHAASPPVRWFLLDAQAITDIDVTAVEALHALREELNQQGIALKVAHANRPLRSLLERTGLTDEIGPQSFFGSVHECVEAFHREFPSTRT